MKPVKFPQQNFVYTKPEGWTDEQCLDLPAFKGHDDAGHPIVISKWELDQRELAEINKNKCVYLMAMDSSIPPMSVHIDSPFNTEDPQPRKGRAIMVTVELEVTQKETFIKVITGSVPKSLILEALSNLTQVMAEELVNEALEVVPQDAVEKYMTGRLKEDREKIAVELKKQYSTPNVVKPKIIRL